jgi:hypothetical protein
LLPCHKKQGIINIAQNITEAKHPRVLFLSFLSFPAPERNDSQNQENRRAAPGKTILRIRRTEERPLEKRFSESGEQKSGPWKNDSQNRGKRKAIPRSKDLEIHSSILPFFHSSILPFFHSSILPIIRFAHVLPFPRISPSLDSLVLSLPPVSQSLWFSSRGSAIGADAIVAEGIAIVAEVIRGEGSVGRDPWEGSVGKGSRSLENESLLPWRKERKVHGCKTFMHKSECLRTQSGSLLEHHIALCGLYLLL